MNLHPAMFMPVLNATTVGQSFIARVDVPQMLITLQARLPEFINTDVSFLRREWSVPLPLPLQELLWMNENENADMRLCAFI